MQTYAKINGEWVTDSDDPDILTETDNAQGVATSYALFTAASRHYEIYNALGVLQSVIDKAGQGITLTYSTASTPSTVAPIAGLLLTVVDPQNRELNFTYDSSGRVHQLMLPDGGSITYNYDVNNNLISVQFPDGATRQYTYNAPTNYAGTNLPGALLGVVDEAGVPYESFTYNSKGQATSSSFAGDVGDTQITYNADGTSTVTYPLGLSSTMSFATVQGINKLAYLDQSCGLQCDQPWQIRTYDANGYPATYTDFNGNITATTYGNAGLLIQRVEAQGGLNQRTTQFTWDSTLRIPLTRIVSNASGTVMNSTQWVYNPIGQPLARCELDPRNGAASGYGCAVTGTTPAGVRRSTYTYCATVDTTQCPLLGLLLAATGPRTDLTQTTTYSYYLSSSATNCGTPGAACYQIGDLRTITDAAGHVTTIASYDGAGRITRITDANGVNADLTYTPRGWLASRSEGGATTRFTYTPYGAVQSITDPDNVVTTYRYDAAHRLVKITDALGNYIQYTLDAAGNKTAEQVYDASGTLHKSLTRNFNSLGQLSKVVDGLSNTIFDASAGDSYDANGNLVQSVDGLGIKRKLGYDALDRLAQTIDNYNGTDSATANSEGDFNFDALDRLDGISDPDGLNTINTYDGLGNFTQQVSPDSGNTTNTYDAAGNLSQSIDARGITRTYTYDALNRATSLSTGNTSEAVTYAYDEANTVTGCVSSYPIGRLTRVVEAAVTTTYCYDAQGRVTQKRQTQGVQTDITSYTYTAAGRLSAMTYPSGTQATYSRNKAGQVTAVSVTPPHGAPSTVVNNITYLPFGPITNYTIGNGQSLMRRYDVNYRLNYIYNTSFTASYQRDAMGRIISRDNYLGLAETYQYDPLGRLTTVKDASGNVRENYTYSKTGDRLSKTGAGQATGVYSYKSGTHWLTTMVNAVRAYDANGNTIGSSVGGETWGYGYDGRNRMTTVQRNGTTVAAYAYNAFGERVAKAVTMPQVVNERFVYNEASQLIAELGTSNRDYIWLGDLPVAVVDNTDTTSITNYVLADGLGTPRSIQDANAATIWSWQLGINSFGELSATSKNSYVYNLRFPGQYFDAETGLHYNIQRDYDPATGRYRQVDPLSFAGGQWSLYGYVDADPLGATDPNGEFGLIGAAVGAAIEVGMQAVQNYTSGNNVFDLNNYNGTDIGVAAAIGAVAPGWGSVAKTAKTSSRAIAALKGQLESARTANRASKLQSRISNHKSTIADAVGTQVGFQGIKELGKWANGADDEEDCK